MKWVGNVERIGNRFVVAKKPIERDNSEHIGVDGIIIL